MKAWEIILSINFDSRINLLPQSSSPSLVYTVEEAPKYPSGTLHPGLWIGINQPHFLQGNWAFHRHSLTATPVLKLIRLIEFLNRSQHFCIFLVGKWKHSNTGKDNVYLATTHFQNVVNSKSFTWRWGQACIMLGAGEGSIYIFHR